MKKPHICEILDKQELTENTFDMVVSFPQSALPGQFIHVLCGEGVLLRRPMSICDAGRGWLRFIFDVRGEGTKRLAQHKIGDSLDILGPLGTGFNIEKKGEDTPIVLGGGIGIFPLLMLAKSLGKNTEAILGFRTKSLIIMEDEFNEACAHTHITTDDGSYGICGLVTDCLTNRISKGDVSSVYACGPMPMMKAVKKITEASGIYCELSLEQRMGCGIGACAVCVCKSNGEYLKVCQNGPVFDAREVDFDD
ncbi:MAG: Dihydroorotate dehydrogenase B (NAD(+)), electron transfer subunit [Firmicutes bacterium ADurb.Bin193]|nr:MAG: Dihydroorotate dehydrogenase B (NAD(+)), electron transfer subunit [Firmicutes bacterium ADurb.Bin193]